MRKCTSSSVIMSCLSLRRWSRGWRGMTPHQLSSIPLCTFILRRLTWRRGDGFCGFLTKQKPQRPSPSDTDVARKGITAFLNTTHSQVVQLFRGQRLFHLQPHALKSGGNSCYETEKITEQLHLVGRLNISMDEPYDECLTGNSTDRAPGVCVQGNS